MSNKTFIQNLVCKATQGDAEAFQQLYQETRQRAWFVALSITKNEHDAQDILQESYLKAYQSLGSLKDPACFQSWLAQIVANKAKNYISRKKPDSFADYEDDNAQNWQEETDTNFLPSECLDQTEAKALVARLVSELPEDQRLVVLMRYYDDMDVAQVAQALGLPEGTVKSRLSRARNKLAAMLKKAQDKGLALHAIAPIPVLVYFLQLIGFEENPGDRLGPLIGLAAAGATAAGATTAAASATSTACTTAAVTVGKGVAIAAAAAVVATCSVAAGLYVYRSRQDLPAVEDTSPTAVITTVAMDPAAPVLLPVDATTQAAVLIEPEHALPTESNNPTHNTPAETPANNLTRNPGIEAEPTTAMAQTATVAAATTFAPATTAIAATTRVTTTAAHPTVTESPTTTTAMQTTTQAQITQTTTTTMFVPPTYTTTQPPTLDYSTMFDFNPARGMIMRYIGSEAFVMVPSAINGVPVVHLSPNAFAGTGVRLVILPEGFCCIQNRSFADNPQLEEIFIPASVGFIAAGAFDGSPNVRIVTQAGSAAHRFAVNNNIPLRLIP